DFVDKNDARRLFLGLLEHVAYAGGADTDEHFHKIGTGNREERHSGLAGNSLGQQRLAGTRRAYHKHASGYLAANALKLARLRQELDQLLHFGLGFFDAGDVGKRDLDLVGGHHARLGFAKRHGATATATALHLPHEVNPHANQQDEREPGNQDLLEEGTLIRRFADNLHLVLKQRADHGLVVGFRTVSRKL